MGFAQTHTGKGWAQTTEDSRPEAANKKQSEIIVFGRFLGARSLQKACKVVVWRSCCGLEGLKTAAWMPSWLQDGLERAK